MAETERFRNDCLRTCAKPLEPGDQNSYSLKRHASNRVKLYLLFPWAAELVHHPRILDLIEAVIGPDILVFHTTVWFRAGAVRPCYRVGRPNAVAARERLRTRHTGLPSQGPTCS